MKFVLFLPIFFHHLILPILSDYTRADGWTFNNETKNFYQVFSKNLSNPDVAKTFCEKKNSNLAAIKSDAEFTWFQRFINQNNSQYHVWVFIYFTYITLLIYIYF